MKARLDLLPCGYFVAVAQSIGSTDEELKAIEHDPSSLTDERKEILTFIMNDAMHWLNAVPPMGIG